MSLLYVPKNELGKKNQMFLSGKDLQILNDIGYYEFDILN